MAVYVDELLHTKLHVRTSSWKWPMYCHLMADTEEELEECARTLKLNRSWRRHDHYDLTVNKRKQAINAGAIEITSREMVEVRRQNRKNS